MPQISKGLKQSYDAQDITFAALTAFREEHTDPATSKLVLRGDESRLLALMNAWQIAQNRVAFHRRVPAPGSLTHKAPAVRKARRDHSVNSGPVSLPAAADELASPADIVDVSAQVAPDQGEQPGSSDAATAPASA